MTIKQDIEKHRLKWAKIAKAYGWYKEPFFIQVWLDIDNTTILDSVSFRGLNKDIIIRS